MQFLIAAKHRASKAIAPFVMVEAEDRELALAEFLSTNTLCKRFADRWDAVSVFPKTKFVLPSNRQEQKRHGIVTLVASKKSKKK